MRSIATLAAAASLAVAPVAAAQQQAPSRAATVERASATLEEPNGLFGVGPYVWVGGVLLLAFIVWQAIESETCCNAEPLSP
jgi:hypothetical protein